MSIRHLDNNWIKTGSLNYKDPSEQNLMLRVISSFRSGVDLFNKSSITGDFRRPSQIKHSYNKLPQLSKRNTTEINTTVNESTDTDLHHTIEAMQNLQSYGRMSILKQDKIQTTLKKRLMTSQARRNLNVSRYNWNHHSYGPVQMKGVVFRKKKQ